MVNTVATFHDRTVPLPLEVFVHVFPFLERKAWASLACVSRVLYYVAQQTVCVDEIAVHVEDDGPSAAANVPPMFVNLCVREVRRVDDLRAFCTGLGDRLRKMEDLDVPLKPGLLPPSLLSLEFRWSFNRPLVPGVF